MQASKRDLKLKRKPGFSFQTDKKGKSKLKEPTNSSSSSYRYDIHHLHSAIGPVHMVITTPYHVLNLMVTYRLW